jgi:C4-dicarboxylate-specific signal transduction histidine kinase
VTRRRSLRQLLLVGITAFAVAAGSVFVAIMLLFGSLRRNLERDTNSRLAEQHAADEIVTAVYGQILASYQQLQAPGERNMERFDSLGQTAYARLRQYLFQPMSLAARLQVETIKELHQALEVEAHGAFDLIARGESMAARARVDEMHRQAEQLQAEMGRFVTLREQERAQLHDEQVALFVRLLIGISSVGVVLIVFATFFARFVQRRVVLPLGQLAEAAVRLGSGDLAARIPPQRHDELQTVARRFNEMADGIQEARTEIEDRNVELSESIRNLKKSQLDLVQQEKLGAIGFMLAGLAHELNNPLAGILGTAELIEEELENHSDPAVRRLIHELVTPLIKEAGRAGDLVRNLLQFSRQSNAQLGSVNLKAAVDISAGLRAYAFAQAGKELRLEVPDTLFVAVEAQRLEHLMMNIMSNALDAICTGGGTRLVVRAESMDTDWVSLTFEDDGPGFLEPDRVFDAFYTTKPVGTGTGLGLSLVQRFIVEAGGTIAAENVPSGGARLTIRLRATAVPAQEAAKVLETPKIHDLSPTRAAMASVTPSSTEPPLRQAGDERRILIVDDEPAIREIQRRFLAKLGVTVLVANDGAEAVAILKRERCDAVITDIRMPGDIDGIALYKWIELTQPDLARRCLFVTGDLEPGRDDTMLGVHPQRVITKPFRRDDYVARVLAVLDDVASPV